MRVAGLFDLAVEFLETLLVGLLDAVLTHATAVFDLWKKQCQSQTTGSILGTVEVPKTHSLLVLFHHDLHGAGIDIL